MTFFFFLTITVLLALEGAALAQLVLRTRDKLLACSFGLPLAALLNVLVVFDWTILGVPLTAVSLLIPHAIMAATLMIIARRTSTLSTNAYQISELWNRRSICLAVICGLLLVSTSIYSFSHAVLLPTFQYDSATNWTMRSKISFVDQHMAFDTTEERGMAKPQYPFLFHALQITANQGQSRWNDTAANAILWLLSLSSFVALFLLLRRLMTVVHALLTVTLVLSVPLLSLHLGQGYADILLLQELLLSLASLITWIRLREKRWLFLSALFAVTTVWTKSEGLFFGFIPWILAVAAIATRDTSRRKESAIAITGELIFALPWTIFALTKGMLLTPHSSDMLLGFHNEGLKEVILGLFDRGSFGIMWYAIAIAMLWLANDLVFTKRHRTLPALLPLIWGFIVFVEILFIYLCTPNVRFPLNAESFYRQMMIPTAMLIVALSVLLSSRNPAAETRSLSGASPSQPS